MNIRMIEATDGLCVALQEREKAQAAREFLFKANQ